MIADVITTDVTSAELLRGATLGSPQTSGPVSLFPLFLDSPHPEPDYISLVRALREGHLRITEVGPTGQVQRVCLENLGDAKALLVDGEEISGALQNRVICSSLIVDAHDTVEAPVVCSQRSRWSRESHEFHDSGVVASTKLRHRMRKDTHASLRSDAGLRAQQGEFWCEISELHARHGVRSATEAMRDAYIAREDDLGRMLARFPLVPGQNGMLVTLGSQPIGLDLISSATVYADEHVRLLTSYLLDTCDSEGEPGDPAAGEAFLDRIRELGTGERFDAAPGVGSSHRFAGDGILGSVLTEDGRCVHAAFFDLGGAAADGPRNREDRTWLAGAPRVEALRQAWRTNEGQPGSGPRGGETGLLRQARQLADYIVTLPGLTFHDFVPYRHIGGLLTDASLQRGISYDRVVPRVQRLIAEHPDPSTSAFSALLAISDPHLLLEWRGTQQITTLLALTHLLQEEGIESVDELRVWLRLPSSKARVMAIRGVGLKTHQYVMLLAGDEDAVPVDRHLRRIVEDAGISGLSFDVMVALYREAAKRLGMTPARLEWSLFLYASAKAQS